MSLIRRFRNIFTWAVCCFMTIERRARRGGLSELSRGRPSIGALLGAEIDAREARGIGRFDAEAKRLKRCRRTCVTVRGHQTIENNAQKSLGGKWNVRGQLAGAGANADRHHVLLTRPDFFVPSPCTISASAYQVRGWIFAGDAIVAIVAIVALGMGMETWFQCSMVDRRAESAVCLGNQTKRNSEVLLRGAKMGRDPF